MVDSVVGQERLSKLDIIIAGDDVNNKKPDPEIYNTAAERLGLPKTACVVVEDSIVGLRAAKAAGMKCVITYTEQTVAEDFYGFGADAKILDFSSGVEVATSAPRAPPARSHTRPVSCSTLSTTVPARARPNAHALVQLL